MFDRLDEEKTFKIAALFLIAAILLSIGLIINGLLRTCEEDYNPCSMCMKAGYHCFNPAKYMPSLAASPQYIITVNESWNTT